MPEPPPVTKGTQDFISKGDKDASPLMVGMALDETRTRKKLLWPDAYTITCTHMSTRAHT